jgi:hypothetical protein
VLHDQAKKLAAEPERNRPPVDLVRILLKWILEKQDMKEWFVMNSVRV